MRKGWCKHFQPSPEGSKCGEGLMLSFDYFNTIPCYRKNQTPCHFYQEPTEAEIKAFDDEMKEAMDRVIRFQEFITPLKKQYKGKYWTGVKKCPECAQDILIEIGQNSHARVSCSTKDCIQYVE